MKITILDVQETNGQLRVKVDSDYGVDDLGISLEMKKADPITGQPLWIFEVKELINKKYGNAVAPVKGLNLIGKEIDTKE